MNALAHVQWQLVPREELTPAQTRGMYELLARHFDGVTPELFARDLAGKNLALLLQRQQTLVGFSTLHAATAAVEGGTVNVVYSGDTIVAPDAWGTTALPRAWIAGVNALCATLPPGPCVWLLLASGFRTYRFLPVFWRKFFPRYDAVTPPETQQLLNLLARERFGTQFDAHTGIVRFMHPQRLCAGLEKIPPGREHNPHIRFFLDRNPGHARGDELVCLTDLCLENLTAAGRRVAQPETCALDPGPC